nr:ThuA domain-containing protein [Cellulosimicrobium sp. CUA-896]
MGAGHVDAPAAGRRDVHARRDHPVVAGLGPVVADDERYCRLDIAPTSHVLLTAHHDGVDHPVAWVSAGARAVYDGLGHGVESYASPSRRDLLRREVDWLLGRS